MDKIHEGIENIKSEITAPLKEEINALKEENCELIDKIDEIETEKENYRLAYDKLAEEHGKLKAEISQNNHSPQMVDRGTDPINFPSPLPSPLPPPSPNSDRYTEKEKMTHFRNFINQNYGWINPNTIKFTKKFAEIPFEFVLDLLHRVSGTGSPNPKYKLKGREAYFPEQKIMVNELKREQMKHYGKDRWQSGSNGKHKYNGCTDTFAHWRFDLKQRK